MHYPECVLKLVHDHYSLLNLLGPKITKELGVEEMEKKGYIITKFNRNIFQLFSNRETL